jgi:3-dehydroquinate synthase
MRRVITLALVVAAAVVGSKLLVEDVLAIDLESAVSAWLATAGPGSAMVIVGLLAADIVLPVPSSLIMVLSGAAFGVVGGALLALTGSILGEWLGFELVRRFGRGFAARFVGDDEFRRFSAILQRHGALAVVFTRPLPIVMETMSVIAGLSSMTRATFLVASLIGTGPIVIVYAYAGAESRRLGSLVPAVVILAAVVAVAWLWYRARLAPVESTGSRP